jgi:Ser/Thr protein kinase RdoA (MazF antagonist)
VPRFSPASADTAAAVTAALEAWRLRPIEPVEQFGGMAINSNNFKVRTAAGAWLCKRVDAGAHDALLQGLGLARWLAPYRVAVPAPLPAHDGSLAVQHAGHAWCVWAFVDGLFFHGGDDEVRAAGQAAGRLHRALAGAPRVLWPAKRWSYLFDDGAAVIQAALSEQAGWDEAFGVEAAEALRRRAPGLLEMTQALAARVAAWGPDVWHPCHGDLHPHNVLMANGEVAAFVDVESLVVAPYPAACGFARYKLVRQAVSAGGDARRLGQAFSDSLRGEDARAGLGDAALRDGALAEVLRRLFLVLRLRFQDGNSQWNHVLGMHLAGLEEVDAISR